MATISGRITVPASPTRFNSTIWAPTNNAVWLFGTAPPEVIIANLSGAQLDLFVDRYDQGGVYRGNVSHFVLGPGTQRTVAWNTVDPQWLGLGLNSQFLVQGTYDVHLSYTDVGVQYCSFGTERQDLTTTLFQLTPEALQIWLAAAEAPELALALAVVWYTFLNTEDLCGFGPPPLPSVGTDFANAPLSTKIQLVQAIAWAHLCRCKAGSPTPIPYPPVIIVVPDGTPSGPVFPCDPAVICDSIVAIRQQLAALSQTLSANYALSTLVQRYQSPFEYIRGATHSGLTGSGAFQIPRSLGVLVAVTERPGGEKEFTGAPPYVSDLGWISVFDRDGMVDEIRLTRDVQVWRSKLFSSANAVGYGLRDGVTIAMTELYAEP